MDTTTDRSGDIRTIHLSGRMTAGRDDECLPETIRRMVRQGARRLVLDLRDVSYMDSTCLGELIEASMSLRRRGGELRLVNVPAKVQRLLDISRLGNLLFESSATGSSGWSGDRKADLTDAVAQRRSRPLSTTKKNGTSLAEA